MLLPLIHYFADTLLKTLTVELLLVMSLFCDVTLVLLLQ